MRALILLECDETQTGTKHICKIGNNNNITALRNHFYSSKIESNSRLIRKLSHSSITDTRTDLSFDLLWRELLKLITSALEDRHTFATLFNVVLNLI